MFFEFVRNNHPKKMQMRYIALLGIALLTLLTISFYVLAQLPFIWLIALSIILLALGMPSILVCLVLAALLI